MKIPDGSLTRAGHALGVVHRVLSDPTEAADLLRIRRCYFDFFGFVDDGSHVLTALLISFDEIKIGFHVSYSELDSSEFNYVVLIDLVVNLFPIGLERSHDQP